MASNEGLTLSETVIDFVKTSDLACDAEHIIVAAQSFSRKAVNVALVQRKCLLGKHFVEEELPSYGKAGCESKIVPELVEYLTSKYGEEFTRSNLYRYAQFYKTYFQIVATLSRQSENVLSWSH